MTSSNHSSDSTVPAAKLAEEQSFSILGREEFAKLAGVVIANTNDIVVITDIPTDNQEPRIVYVNEAFVRETGYLANEVLGKNPRILQGPRSDPETKGRIFAALKEWKHIREEIINYRKNGEEFWQELNIFPIANEAGWFTHWVSIQRDITERKLSEQIIIETKNRLELAARAGAVGIWDFDFFNNRLVWDDQMCILYGIARDQFGGSYDDWTKRLHHDDRAAAELRITKALEGASEFNTQFRVVWPDGSIHFIRGLAVVKRDADNKPLRMVGTNWDIT
jgi:PAS domain S-box-containing protein